MPRRPASPQLGSAPSPPARRPSPPYLIAVLRYRLYDIDRVISRTAAYATVTGLLVGVYAGLLLLATQVLGVQALDTRNRIER
jgi:hypothetical protein